MKTANIPGVLVNIHGYSDNSSKKPYSPNSNASPWPKLFIPNKSKQPSPSCGPSNTGGLNPNDTATNTRQICQLCGETGHVASQCFKRFQRGFLGLGNDGQFTEKQIAMAIQALHGHTFSYPVDTSSTDNLMNKVDKLHMKEPYHDKDHVHTAK
jgi:hypothetical protein